VRCLEDPDFASSVGWSPPGGRRSVRADFQVGYAEVRHFVPSNASPNGAREHPERDDIAARCENSNVLIGQRLARIDFARQVVQ
jgi:hypothetical protein